MSEPLERKPRGRRVPSWAIHSAAGIRYPGGDGVDWWTTSAPGYVAPAPAPMLTEAPQLALPIFSDDCTPEPTP